MTNQFHIGVPARDNPLLVLEQAQDLNREGEQQQTLQRNSKDAFLEQQSEVETTAAARSGPRAKGVIGSGWAHQEGFRHDGQGEYKRVTGREIASERER